MFGSSDSVKSRFLARNLSGLTRWRSCLYGLIVRAADGAGLSVVLLDIVRQKSLRQILFLETSEFQEVVDWIISFWFKGPLAPKSNSPPIQNLCTHPSYRKRSSNNGYDSLLLNNKVRIPTCICIANCRERRSVYQFNYLLKYHFLPIMGHNFWWKTSSPENACVGG